METEAPSQTSRRTTVGPVLWGAGTALAAATAVTLIAAGWITLRGYPDHAQHLTIPLTNIKAVAGEAEETETGVRLIPNDRGVAIMLFDGAPWFPAFQFSEITIEIANATSLRGAEVLWATRQAPEKTGSLPLKSDGKVLTATLADSPQWADRVNGIGIAITSNGPADLETVTLAPPNPTIRYLLQRIWWEWTFQEGYQGSTINRLEGAGEATLLPVGLAGGMATALGTAILAIAMMTAASLHRYRVPTFVSAIAVFWLLAALPWLSELWSEAAWAVATYSGKTEAERRLSEPDADLYAAAQKVKSIAPSEVSRIWLLSGNTDFTDFSRWKLKYYMAPLNTTLAVHGLPSPEHGWVKAGDYVLVSGPDSKIIKSPRFELDPGYTARPLGNFHGFALLRIVSE